ncbi:hypothetical protein EV359DRAFT_68145 [Lentinula novae-zelandiae]|nr:hypothetical protein EV359DRAFT_68145 [Lentinula novae-zelandiae]
MPSRSVLTTVIAFGAASSALAIPLPSSSALDGTVSFSTIPALAPTTINSHFLRFHPLAHYAGELDKQHIDAVAQLLEKENVVVPLPSPKPDVSAQLVPVPIPVDVTPVSEQLANVVRISYILQFPFDVFDEHTESPFPLLDPTVVLPKPRTWAFSPSYRTTPMADKEVTNYLLKLPEPDRIALQMHIKMSSLIEKQTQTSNNWVEFQKMEGVEGFIQEVTQTVEYQSIGSFPEFIKAYYVCVKHQLLGWCI